MGPMLQPGGRVIATNLSLRDLIRAVYSLDDTQIVGAPRWVDEDTFDLVAKAADDISAEEARALMRTLLAERFNLASHIETRQLPVYVLTSGADRRAAKLQLRRSGEDCAPLTMPPGIPPPPPPPPPSGGVLHFEGLAPARPHAAEPPTSRDICRLARSPWTALPAAYRRSWNVL